MSDGLPQERGQSGTECNCIYEAHCDRTRPGCRLAAGGSINDGGGVCGPVERGEIKRATHPTPCPRCPVRGELQSIIAAALAVLGTEGATNYEKVQAAGLILSGATSPVCECHPGECTGRGLVDPAVCRRNRAREARDPCR